MIRHRLLCLGYFDFGSVGLFNLGFLSLFAAYAQQSQNAAADVQSSQPTDVVAAVTGLRTLGGVVISWLIGVIITAACIVGVAAVGELVDDRILAALGAANGAFLVFDAGGLLGSGLVDHPLEAVWCRVGIVAALALMPVVGAVILPLCTVAVGMIAACCRDRCGFKNLLADGAFLMLSAVGGFGSCRVNDPLAGTVSRNIGLIAAPALMPVIGVVILPLGAVAVGMAWRRILIGGLELHIIAGHGEGGSRLGGVCQSDIALQHDPLVKDLACLRCVRRNGHNGVLRDLVRDWCSCGNGGRALDDRDRVLGRGWASDEPCLAAVGALAGVENPFALALFCGFAAVPFVAELINDMTVAENLSAAGCALLVAAITCGGASGLNHIDQLGVAGNFVEGRGRNALLRDPVARCAVLVAGIALLGTGRRSYIPQFKWTAMPEVASLALYGAAASRAAVVALIGAMSAVARIDVIAFAAMARVCGGRVGRAVVVQRLQWTGMTGVCRGVDIRTGTDDIAAVCAGGVAGVALAVADLCLRIKHRGAAAVVTACIDRLEEELAAAYRIKASVKRKFMREDALLGAGGHIMRFVFACFEQARELVALAFANAAHETFMGIPMLIDPSDIVFRHFFAVVRVNDLASLIIAEGMGGSQLCLRRFHGVRRVTLSADDVVVGVVLLTGLGGNRQPQRGGVHAFKMIRPLIQLVGRRRGTLIILPIPLIGQLVALQASCRDREGDRMIFIVQQAVFRLFVIIIVDRGLALDALGLAGDNDGAAADVAADLAHALGVIFMVGRIQLFAVAIAAGVPVLRSVSLPGGGGYVGMPGARMLRLQMILKIRVAEAPVVMIAAHSSHGIEAAVLAALIAAVLAGIAVVEAQTAVLAEVIRIVRIHYAHPLGAVGVAFAALFAQLAGFAELVLVLLIRDPAAAALADVLVPLGAFHAGLAVRAAAALGVIPAAVDAQTAVLAALFGQQAFLALLAGGVAIDAVYDAGIIVVNALVHRTEAAVAQRTVHWVAVIVCAVIAEAAGVADGYGAAGALMAFAAQLVILADVALAAGGAVLFLHALRALVALIAPIGCIEQTLTTIVAVEFNEAVGVAVNSAEPATVAHILSPVVVVAVFTIFAVVVVFPKGVGGNHHTRYQ